ncbi:MAG: winged helix-turn-helix domain-containing protein [Anaerolineaceae bacterium]|nr:winged helix-turn-helix domain-containing protein [Anaerolineaceae bacterium]
MVPHEKVAVCKPDDERGTLQSLFANDQYDQISCYVEAEYAQALGNAEAERAAMLAAAKQLVASCAEMQKEISFHQQAFHHSKRRREKLKIELKKLLQMVNVAPETAVPPTQPSLWQRVSRLWHQGPLPLPQPPEPTDAVKEQTAAAPPLRQQPESPIRPLINTQSAYPQLTIYCLGTFRAYEDEHPIEDWPSRKGKAIFKYLLLHRQKRITKEVLMDQFWPEATADAARNNLNVAIYGLRQALRNGYPDFSHVLFEDDCYFLNPQMEIWVDVEQFEAVYKKACEMMQRGETAVAIPDLHAAELLYQGELLAEDRYEDWPAARRQQLQRHYLQLLTHICNHYFATQQYATCITFANKLLRVEPCHEATHRLLMRAYARQQQGYLALRQYHQCVELLEEELAVPPDPATTRLYEAIRSHEPI